METSIFSGNQSLHALDESKQMAGTRLANKRLSSELGLVPGGLCKQAAGSSLVRLARSMIRPEGDNSQGRQCQFG